MDLGEEIGDVGTLCDESQQSLQSLAFLGVEFTIKERSNIGVFGVIVEMSIGTDPENHGRCFAQGLCCGSELRKHVLGFQFGGFDLLR